MDIGFNIDWSGACTSEVDDVFDQSAANRINQSIAEYQEVLRSAGNGWGAELLSCRY